MKAKGKTRWPAALGALALLAGGCWLPPRVPPVNPPPVYNSSDFAQQAVDLENEGRFAEAAHRYRLALARGPENLHLRYRLGYCLACSGQPEEAAREYVRALDQAPRNTELKRSIYTNLGLTYLDLGRFTAAEGVFRQGLGLVPGSAECQTGIGAALLGQERLPQSRAALVQALGLDRNFAYAHYWLARLEEHEQNWDAAVASYRRAIDCQPHFQVPYQDLEALLRRRGRLEEAARVRIQAEHYRGPVDMARPPAPGFGWGRPSRVGLPPD